MIDVVFLLVTFFVFALALTVRLKVSTITLPGIGQGASPGAEQRLILGLTESGDLLLDGAPVAWDGVGQVIEARLAGAEAPALYIAADEGAPTGRLMELLDALAERGVRDLKFLRRPASGPEPGAAP